MFVIRRMPKRHNPRYYKGLIEKFFDIVIYLHVAKTPKYSKYSKILRMRKCVGMFVQINEKKKLQFNR